MNIFQRFHDLVSLQSSKFEKVLKDNKLKNTIRIVASLRCHIIF